MKPITADILVISSYPEKGTTHGGKTVGVASYAKNTITNIATSPQKPTVVVLAEQLTVKKEVYTDEGISIHRIWQRNSAQLYIQLLREVMKHKTKRILVEFELAMFGNPLVTSLFPFFLMVLRLLDKEVTVVIHQVINDLSQMSGHINMNKKSARINVMNFGLQMLYRSIVHFASEVIVFEDVLKQHATMWGKSEKITVIPHGIEQRTQIPTLKAKKILGFNANETVLLCFGYLAWYKGTDWIIEAIKGMSLPGKTIRLVLAGGINPNYNNNVYQQQFIETIKTVAKNSNGKIIVTDYVAENAIAAYFSAADLVLFPYRTLMSASGPLSLAVAYEKPWMISTPMKKLLETADIASIMNELQLTSDEITFSLHNKAFQRSIRKTLTNQKTLKKLIALSVALKEMRSFKHIGTVYAHNILSEKVTLGQPQIKPVSLIQA